MNKKYIKNTAILFASMTITKVVGAVFKIPLANILGGTGMGYFSTAYGLYSPVFALTAAGVPAVMMRLTAQNIAAGRPENALKTRRTALLLFSMLGLAGTLVVALFSGFFAEHVACSPESAPAVAAIAPAVMICCVASVFRGYYEGMSDVVPSAAAAVAEAVSRAAAGLALSFGVVFYAKYRFENGLDVFGVLYAADAEDGGNVRSFLFDDVVEANVEIGDLLVAGALCEAEPVSGSFVVDAKLHSAVGAQLLRYLDKVVVGEVGVYGHGEDNVLTVTAHVLHAGERLAVGGAADSALVGEVVIVWVIPLEADFLVCECVACACRPGLVQRVVAVHQAYCAVGSAHLVEYVVLVYVLAALAAVAEVNGALCRAHFD